MSIITIIGAGMMGSALAFPARENENEVRIVGTHLDREIIEGCKNNNQHPKFDRKFPEGISFYQIEELQEALQGVDFVIGGVSSFGVEWFGEEILPQIDESIPVLSVTKGLMNQEDGTLLTYLDVWEAMLEKKGRKLCLSCVLKLQTKKKLRLAALYKIAVERKNAVLDLPGIVFMFIPHKCTIFFDIQLILQFSDDRTSK